MDKIALKGVLEAFKAIEVGVVNRKVICVICQSLEKATYLIPVKRNALSPLSILTRFATTDISNAINSFALDDLEISGQRRNNSLVAVKCYQNLLSRL